MECERPTAEETSVKEKRDVGFSGQMVKACDLQRRVGTSMLLGERVLSSKYRSQSIEGSGSPLAFFFCNIDATAQMLATESAR